MTTRFADRVTNQAAERVRARAEPWWDSYTAPLRVTFPAQGMQREIAHGLEAIPDGFVVVYADADVIAEPGVAWTHDLAFLRAGADNAQAIVIFYTLREDPRDA